MDRGGSAPPTRQLPIPMSLHQRRQSTATLYPAEQYGSCPQAVMGLSYDWTAMTTGHQHVAQRQYQPGDRLAARLDVAGRRRAVLCAANGSELHLQQVIILLTDGLNTQNRWFDAKSQIDARQQLTCNNINAAGITLYTIQVNTGGDPTRRCCKTAPALRANIQTPPSSSVDIGERDRDDVPPDRHQPDQSVRRQIASRRRPAPNKKPGQTSRASP